MTNIERLVLPMGLEFHDYLHDETKTVGYADSISFPSTEEDIRALLRHHSQKGEKVTIQGNRTGLTVAPEAAPAEEESPAEEVAEEEAPAEAAEVPAEEEVVTVAPVEEVPVEADEQMSIEENIAPEPSSREDKLRMIENLLRRN